MTPSRCSASAPRTAACRMASSCPAYTATPGRVAYRQSAVRELQGNERLLPVGEVVVHVKGAPGNDLRVRGERHDAYVHVGQAHHGPDAGGLALHDVRGTKTEPDGGLGQEELEPPARLEEDLLAFKPGRDGGRVVAPAVDVGDGEDAPRVLCGLDPAALHRWLEVAAQPRLCLQVRDVPLHRGELRPVPVLPRVELVQRRLGQGDQGRARVFADLGGVCPRSHLGKRGHCLSGLHAGYVRLAGPDMAGHVTAGYPGQAAATR